ncbi:MAG: TetR/AcrR family transcriptional regulator [Bacteriovorax sp.]|nr:TetR/AcrR family transcriptional regulator [Bacteriovorax sp.]
MNKKEDILNAAIELFSKRGLEGVSIREIATLANVHFASIRYHYGDKEELYKACISKHGESRLLSAQKFLSAEPKNHEDMRLRLGYAIDDVFRIHNENPFLTKLILLEVESTDHRSDLILKKTMVAMTETYASFFKACQAKKFIDKNLDPLFLTQSLMGILHHFMRTEHIRERLLAHKPLEDRENKEIMIKNIITLILGKK